MNDGWYDKSNKTSFNILWSCNFHVKYLRRNKLSRWITFQMAHWKKSKVSNKESHWKDSNRRSNYQNSYRNRPKRRRWCSAFDSRLKQIRKRFHWRYFERISSLKSSSSSFDLRAYLYFSRTWRWTSWFIWSNPLIRSWGSLWKGSWKVRKKNWSIHFLLNKDHWRNHQAIGRKRGVRFRGRN